MLWGIAIGLKPASEHVRHSPDFNIFPQSPRNHAVRFVPTFFTMIPRLVAGHINQDCHPMLLREMGWSGQVVGIIGCLAAYNEYDSERNHLKKHDPALIHCSIQ